MDEHQSQRETERPDVLFFLLTPCTRKKQILVLVIILNHARVARGVVPLPSTKNSKYNDCLVFNRVIYLLK